METLLLILLGVHTALKEDFNPTTVVMVYGTTLHLPGEFFTLSLTPDPSNFVIVSRRLVDRRTLLMVVHVSVYWTSMLIRHHKLPLDDVNSKMTCPIRD